MAEWTGWRMLSLTHAAAAAALLCLQPQSTISSLQTALALYNCDHYEW